MATSIGVAVGQDGNLYELFSDGSKILKEAGYQARMDAFVQQLNSTTNRSFVSTTPTPTVSSTPPTVSTAATTATNSTTQVKVATRDIILFDDGAVPIELMSDLVFEDIGGQELLSVARRDTVNGQKISYQPIKNLSSIEQQYNPNNIVSLQATADKFFANFPIKLDDKIPNEPTGPNGKHIYIDSVTGDLVVEAVNLAEDEQLEIQVLTSGTIYETDF